jgi:hypothetical protein
MNNETQAVFALLGQTYFDRVVLNGQVQLLNQQVGELQGKLMKQEKDDVSRETEAVSPTD